MARSWIGCTLVALCLIGLTAPAAAQQPAPNYERQEDVIYGRKFGTALTMDVFTPKESAKGVGVIFVVSGGWFSAHEAINMGFVQPMVNRGFTVFAVVHGSQPKFTIQECIADMTRSVRFIRANAERFKIDPDRLGVYGGSAGGHLSLMLGVNSDKGNPDAKDPVERASSRVQAVTCFYPPTDFQNYGKEGESGLGVGTLGWLPAPFDFEVFDNEKKVFVPVTDAAQRTEIGKQISPITHVTEDDPPTQIFHGDADKLVPLQQAEIFIEKLKSVHVPAELVLRPGQGHGWKEMPQDLEAMADWFEKYLAAKPAAEVEKQP